jgi:hypothetical protein
MQDNKVYTQLAVNYELNDRDLKKKMAAFGEELRYYVLLAASIIGIENSKRVKDTPCGVTENSEEFVSDLMGLTSFEPDDTFRVVLENCLIETMRDELSFNCLNCVNFERCLNAETLSVGELFCSRINGKDTEDIRNEIKKQINSALKNTPFADSQEAHLLCKDFVHQRNKSSATEVFTRYRDIAASLSNEYGINYSKIQQKIVELNMDFYEKYPCK